ncbi:AAA family ATPase [Bradyrhizobium sp. SYSU BS000235]|uniref:AAA family ATPase n=1 Tax=Bradyrhizobium sp. SYSU BS000235 TaxID=3411332 RepID=UPI003C774ADA
MWSSEATSSTSPTGTSTIPSSDALARVFLEQLARSSIAEDNLFPGIEIPDDPFATISYDPSAVVVPADRLTVRSDLAAVAVLLARSIEAEPGLLEEMRCGTLSVTIATRNSELVGLVARVLRTCVFATEVHTSPKQHLASCGKRAPRLTLVRDGTERGHTPDKGNELVVSAIHELRQIIGIAPEPQRYLPRDLMRAADLHLVLGNLDESALRLVIEAVTGTTPTGPIDHDLVSVVDVGDLPLAIRKRQSPEECLKRLSEIIRNKRISDDGGPKLEELSGYGKAKDWGLNLAADLAAYKRGRLDWASIDKGLLLDGPPGVGKTQFAKALARSADVPIVATSVAQWNAASHLSGTLQAMRTDFARATKLAPSILFVDELDGISDRARLQGEYVEYWSQIVNLLLELLDGIDERSGVVVIGATNHPDRIDPAIRRVGRLDRTVTIERPDTDDLCKIIRFHLKQDLADADLVPLALAGRGGTGADVEAWVRRSRSLARRRNRSLTAEDILQEIRGHHPDIPSQLRHAIAIHESGHVIVGTILGCYQPDMVWLNQVGGRTSGRLESSDVYTLAGLDNLITTLLAGRAAERTFLDPTEVTIGAGGGNNSDLARATEIALNIESAFGLGEHGLLHLPAISREKMLLDKSVRTTIKRRLNDCRQRAQAIIQSNRATTLAIADALKRNGYLDRSTIAQIMSQQRASHLAKINVTEYSSTE